MDLFDRVIDDFSEKIILLELVHSYKLRVILSSADENLGKFIKTYHKNFEITFSMLSKDKNKRIVIDLCIKNFS